MSNLRRLREYLGYSREQIATYLNITVIQLLMIEDNQAKLTKDEAGKLSRLYKCSLDFPINDEVADEDVINQCKAYLYERKCRGQ
jgi:transcriptional regulator with XRE-family HTH domain